jgi:dTDP-4-amino-4,6-dideoxygalactose transaminase
MHRLYFAEWTRAEVGAALAALTARQAVDGPALAALRSRLGVLLGRPVFLVGRGRTALEIALQEFAERRPLRDEVVFPAYTCPAVIDGIRACGLRPVAADVGTDLNLDPAGLRRRLSSRTLAVVAAHMYAAPAAILDIEAICAAADVFLLDDAAQVVGVDVGGRPLGTFGACGLLSFSQSKTVVAGIGDAGGVLIVNEPGLSGGLQRRCEALPPQSYGAMDFLRALAEVPLQGRAAATRYYAGRLRGLLSAGSQRGCYRYRPYRMANALAAVALQQLDSLPTRLLGRIRVAQAYAERLSAADGPSLAQCAPGRYLSRVLVRLPPGCDPLSAGAALAERGVQTRRGYPVAAGLASEQPAAAAAAARLIEIPSHSAMPEEAVAEIAQATVQVCLAGRSQAGSAR